MATMVRLRLLQRVARLGGGSWNAGEQAGFTPEEAQRMVARRLAEPIVEPLLKAPEAAPRDRMAKAAPIKKGV